MTIIFLFLSLLAFTESNTLNNNTPEDVAQTWTDETRSYIIKSHVLKNEGNFNDFVANTIQIGTSNAALARHWWNNASTTSTRFTGWIDDVKIYDKPLTEEEILCDFTFDKSKDRNRNYQK